MKNHQYGDDLDAMYLKSKKDIFWFTELISTIILTIATLGILISLMSLFEGGNSIPLTISVVIFLLALVPRLLAAMGQMQKAHYAKS